eukprot:10647777-Ditylum_brightwellii.AAC.1
MVKVATHLACFDMIYLSENFPLLSPKQADTNKSLCNQNKLTTNLIRKWDQIGNGKLITVPQIAETIMRLFTYLVNRSDEYIYNMQWSLTYLLNSMATYLQETIISTLNSNYKT